MANRTPGLAFKRGAVPGTVEHGLSGIVVDGVEDAPAVLPASIAVDRTRIRRRFEERFSLERRACDDIALHGEVLSRGGASARVPAGMADQPARDAA
ncbi:MAG: hypothetical protein J2P48_20375 [Alphaproteobacteria bacterium]|nr:hypothetical protein [Alphaproteobacteria bacterium]